MKRGICLLLLLIAIVMVLGGCTKRRSHPPTGVVYADEYGNYYYPDGTPFKGRVLNGGYYDYTARYNPPVDPLTQEEVNQYHQQAQRMMQQYRANQGQYARQPRQSQSYAAPDIQVPSTRAPKDVEK